PATSDAIAYGDEQSMRILPSQSSVMNAQRGSTCGLTTVRSSPYRSPISPQYSTDAPPSGSAPIRTPESPIASGSRTFARSSTYVVRKSCLCTCSDVSAWVSGTRGTLPTPVRRSSFARSAIQPVASDPAGPPCGGLYLKPPSRGGLCDGVTTIPS